MACVAQFVGVASHKQKVISSTPGQHMPRPWVPSSVREGRATNDVSVSLSPFPSLDELIFILEYLQNFSAN